ncbi:hypothetical protein DFH08DRAFT_144456 [Mycena albidolilacea]|uniref:Uncharacterized protein n=1 Tax=Mycena albidolilacea TaxID=1033008 RepID=A0AAD7A4Q4_9AGAR|nr:hypothetical protein DFH08DRAFT_144456 [Mycena albidolilacea]
MSSFTETSPVNMSNERDWANNLGMLDWDSTSIVFTKRSLMEFLKYTGTTVDTNFNNIQKLPRYVKFGKISGSSPAASTVAPATSTGSIATSPSSDFKPTRRVRDPPGGHRTNIFADEDVLDALSMAPPKEQAVTTLQAVATQSPAVNVATSDGTGIKPSRRVREAPGGNSTLGSIWGNDEPEEFKPTRRVRQAPGGGSSGIF